MNRRYIVFGLSVFLALALAVPALGGPSNPVASMSASVKKIAQKALKTAKSAKKTANTALGTAEEAKTNAAKAQTTANEAKTNAGKAQTTANEAKTNAGKAQTTANEAKTAAAAAQATANSAQATANSKFGHTEETFAEPTGESTTAVKSELIACPAGRTVTGGGYSIQGTANQVTVTLSEAYFNSWDVSARAISGFTPNWGLTVAVQCAFP